MRRGRSSRRAAEGGAASPQIEGPPGFAFAGGELEPQRGFGRHVEGANGLPQRSLPVHLARRLGTLSGPFDEELFLYYEGRRLEPARPPRSACR